MAKAGFVAIIGRPNVGKSTLMNTLIGQKIAITSYKPQTTRNKIKTVYTEERGQIVFLDTPGIHKDKDGLSRYMYKAVQSTLKEADCALWLVEPRAKMDDTDRDALRLLAEFDKPVIIAVTKLDTVKKEMVLPVIEMYAGAWKECSDKEPCGIIPVSSRTKAGLDDLMSSLFAALPEGEAFYDEETVTTETERSIAAEIIREKALRLLQEEVPHGIAVQILTMKFRKGRGGAAVCDIEAEIICERESHKGIIIGAGGAMLKKIGTAARGDIENMLETKVNLKLWVKVRKDWKDNEAVLRGFGYDAAGL